MQVPFNRATTVGREAHYVLQAMASGHLCGDGPYTREVSELLEQQLGVHKALLTTSCTHALEMAGQLLQLGPGDEVIVPAFTFVSTANAFALFGCKPVFLDSRSDTFNLDEEQLESAITPKTRAIVVVHYGGVACAMDSILETAARYDLPVIEDNAHGLFASYRGRMLGTLGSLGTQSFHHTKNFSSGEGGALLVNDPTLALRAEIIREKGTNRTQFFRGEADKYTWVDLGSSYLPSELNAAYLLGQLEARQLIQTRRERLWRRYQSELGEFESKSVRLPVTPPDCDQPYHVFPLLFDTPERRDEFIKFMRDNGVATPFHYVPLHTSPMGRRFGGAAGQCPVAESISVRLARLPLFYDLGDDEQDWVLHCAKRFLQSDASPWLAPPPARPRHSDRLSAPPPH